VLLKWKVALRVDAGDSAPALPLQTLKSPQVVDYLGASRQTWLSFAVFLVREPESKINNQSLPRNVILFLKIDNACKNTSIPDCGYS
jgi:hypothetical protein